MAVFSFSMGVPQKPAPCYKYLLHYTPPAHPAVSMITSCQKRNVASFPLSCDDSLASNTFLSTQVWGNSVASKHVTLLAADSRHGRSRQCLELSSSLLLLIRFPGLSHSHDSSYSNQWLKLLRTPASPSQTPVESGSCMVPPDVGHRQVDTTTHPPIL